MNIGQEKHEVATSMATTTMGQGPLKALTVGLLQTYSDINQRFYERKNGNAPVIKQNLGPAVTNRRNKAAPSSTVQISNDEGFCKITPGERFGPSNRYEAVKKLGSGQFAVVVACRDHSLSPPVPFCIPPSAAH